jgi:hypothetical protein
VGTQLGGSNGLNMQLSRPGLVPAFTEADARAYVLTHPMRLFRQANGNPPTFVSLQFLTVAQAEAPGGPTRQDPLGNGLAPDHLVGVVTLSGQFPQSNIGPRVPVSDATPYPLGPERIYTKGVLIFDATNGNLLLRGLTAWMGQ